MTKVVSFVGAKGGTLKTASVAAVAHLAAKGGLRVVMVDADPQGDLTSRSGYDRVSDPVSAEAVHVRFSGERELPLQLLRGGRSLEAIDLGGAARHLGRAVALAPDLVVVDTPPALGPISSAMIAQSDVVLIPAVPGKESLEKIGEIISLAGERVQIRVLLTLANRRSNLFAWMQDQVDTHFVGLRMEHVFPFEMAAGEAALYEKPVTCYAPRSSNAAAYCDLLRELLGMMRLTRVGLSSLVEAT
jgi:chromosome partitioning protein